MLLWLKNNFPKLLLASIVSILVLIEGWKTSGVLENSRSLLYPGGYVYTFQSEKHGLWPVNKESSYYMLAAQGFLGVKESNLNVGCIYEFYRTGYSFLLRTFWFLDPIEAVLLLDAIVWFLACLSIFFTCKNMNLSDITAFFSVFFTLIFGGFLQSVGEGMPHVLGYSSGYFIFFFLSYFKPWRKDATFADDWPVYAFMGLWQLTYGTAIFFMPYLLLSTGYRYYQKKHFLGKEFLLLFLTAVIPYLTMTLFVKGVFQTSGGVLNLVLDRISSSYAGWHNLFFHYTYVLWDSFVSLGPIAFIGVAGLILHILKYQDVKWKIILIITFCQFLGMAFLLLPLAGRGYATASFYPALCLGAALLMEHLWKKASFFSKPVAIILVSSCFIYSFSSKFGFVLFDRVFFTGLQNLNDSFWKYEIAYFK
jgi:hypothetical protein